MQSFKELDLNPSLMRAVTEMGFETPTPIQAQTLPILLDEPTDFLGLAATGTGKTAAFGLPLLTRINTHQRGVQALILCPTRELAIQVSGQIDLMGKYMGIKSLPIYGGAPYAEQIHGLKRGIQVVVGTPGRVVDHMQRGTLNLEGLTTLILDEADEMISMGFKDDLEAVLGAVPEGQANIWLFSATMSPDVRRVADEYLKSPKQVQVNRTEMLSSSVEQIYYTTQESNKPEVLCKILDAADDIYGIVFCQTKALVIDLNQYLMGRGYRTDCLHGDMDQNARDRTMRGFREKRVNILIATDVACRGLDVKDITHVINYSIPREMDNYVHRIGRTARSGKAGLALSLVTPSHRGLVRRIEQMTKTRMTEGRIPTRKEIGIRRIAKSLDTFMGQTSGTRAAELLDAPWKMAIEAMSKEEIAGRFLALMLPEVFAEREEAKAVRSSGRLPVAKIDGREPRGSSDYSVRSTAPRSYGAGRSGGGYGGGGYGKPGGYDRPRRTEGYSNDRPAVRPSAGVVRTDGPVGIMRPSGESPVGVKRMSPVTVKPVGESSGPIGVKNGRPSTYARPERKSDGPWGGDRKPRYGASAPTGDRKPRFGENTKPRFGAGAPAGDRKPRFGASATEGKPATRWSWGKSDKKPSAAQGS